MKIELQIFEDLCNSEIPNWIDTGFHSIPLSSRMGFLGVSLIRQMHEKNWWIPGLKCHLLACWGLSAFLSLQPQHCLPWPIPHPLIPSQSLTIFFRLLRRPFMKRIASHYHKWKSLTFRDISLGNSKYNNNEIFPHSWELILGRVSKLQTSPLHLKYD